MFKKLIKTIISTVITAYVTKFVTEALERKPLKTRVREGKEKVAEVKEATVQKVDDLKTKAQIKADELIEERDINNGL